MTQKPVTLVGDVGGTTTKLALPDEKLAVREIRRYPSREHDSLSHIVREFLHSRAQPVTHACFGIAGPVRGGSVITTNLPWVVEAADLARLIGLSDVLLINDIEAIGHGIGTLDASGLVTAHRGAGPASGNAAVMAAGTGLGEAGSTGTARDIGRLPLRASTPASHRETTSRWRCCTFCWRSTSTSAGSACCRARPRCGWL